jgi:hypothetical protein
MRYNEISDAATMPRRVPVHDAAPRNLPIRTAWRGVHIHPSALPRPYHYGASPQRLRPLVPKNG